MPKWSDSLKVIGNVAPMIAAAAGGPLAGAAVTSIESVFGLHPQGDLPKRQDAVAAAIAGATPENLLDLKKADEDFQVRMAQAGFADAESLAKLAYDDTDSARKREMAVKDWTPRMLAIAVTAGFFAVLFYISFFSVPPSSRDPLNIMLGALGAGWSGIITYYFGSSSDSHRKTELLAGQPQSVR